MTPQNDPKKWSQYDHTRNTVTMAVQPVIAETRRVRVLFRSINPDERSLKIDDHIKRQGETNKR